MVFANIGLTRQGLEHTSYHTRGEHANHYTTDAVHTIGRAYYIALLINEFDSLTHIFLKVFLVFD